jgi:predicted dehydrogenase
LSWPAHAFPITWTSSRSRAATGHGRRRTPSEYNIEQAYGSYDALLEDPAVEAVYISLPNSMHVKWTLRALAARKHVLCEKPFSRRAFEVERAFNVADGRGSSSRKVSCGVTTRRRRRSPDSWPKGSAPTRLRGRPQRARARTRNQEA